MCNLSVNCVAEAHFPFGSTKLTIITLTLFGQKCFLRLTILLYSRTWVVGQAKSIEVEMMSVIFNATILLNGAKFRCLVSWISSTKIACMDMMTNMAFISARNCCTVSWRLIRLISLTSVLTMKEDCMIILTTGEGRWKLFMRGSRQTRRHDSLSISSSWQFVTHKVDSSCSTSLQPWIAGMLMRLLVHLRTI